MIVSVLGGEENDGVDGISAIFLIYRPKYDSYVLGNSNTANSNLPFRHVETLSM